MRTLSLLLAASLVTGCVASIRGEVRPPPPSLLAPCGDPVALPDRSLSDQEAEVLWGRDRSGYRACSSRHKGLADWAASLPGVTPE